MRRDEKRCPGSGQFVEPSKCGTYYQCSRCRRPMKNARKMSYARPHGLPAGSCPVERPTTIPNLAFTDDGDYDLSTSEKRLAAAEQMLRAIAIVPSAYNARGAEWCRDEMARLATEGAVKLREARPDYPLRCRYTDCPERHPIAFENEEDSNDERNERVTCARCRKSMGLPPVEED